MRNRPYGFEIYLVNLKTMRTIAQIFVAFSEKLNFNYFSYLKFLPRWIVTRIAIGKAADFTLDMETIYQVAKKVIFDLVFKF